MDATLCRVCKEVIPVERLEILPETVVCVQHSVEQPYRAMIYTSAKHKIVEIVPIRADDPLLDYLGEDGLSIPLSKEE